MTSWARIIGPSTTAALLMLSLGACSKDPTPAPAASNSASKGTKTNANVKIKQTSLEWAAPEAFSLVPSPSSMRLATYKFAHVEGDADDAEMTVSQVGGGVAGNIDRWKKQVQGTTREETTLDVSGLKVTILWLEGSYTGMGMPGAPSGPKDGYALLGAVVEPAAGKGDPHFFKLTGPTKTVEAARPAFDELVQSFKPRG